MILQRDGWSFLDLSPGQSGSTDGGTTAVQRQDSLTIIDEFFNVSVPSMFCCSSSSLL